MCLQITCEIHFTVKNEIVRKKNYPSNICAKINGSVLLKQSSIILWQFYHHNFRLDTTINVMPNSYSLTWSLQVEGELEGSTQKKSEQLSYNHSRICGMKLSRHFLSAVFLTCVKLESK